MTGGLLQLVAYGAQDIYLVGNPTITFFKSIYKRHTNFAIESIEQTFNGTPGFGKSVSCLISRNGDLLSNIYVQVILPDLAESSLNAFSVDSHGIDGPNRRYTRWIDNIGHFLFQSIDIEIGGQLIDRHYGDWLEIWAQLTVSASMMPGYRKMIGQDPKNSIGQNTGLQADVFRTPTDADQSDTVLAGREIYIPLQFWFCRDLGMSLPLIALQNHKIHINITFRKASELIMTYEGDNAESSSWIKDDSLVDHGALTASLWVDYIFLDTDERRKFAQVSHEYLIEQLQFNGDEHALSGTDDNPNIERYHLFFDHPVKELFWVIKGFEDTNEWSNYTNTQLRSVPPLISVAINESETDVGLTGLPMGPLTEHDVSVDFEYIVDIPKGETLTPDDIDFIVGYTILGVGDVIVINDGDISNNISIVVSAVEDGVPTEFILLDSIVAGVMYDEIYKVDKLGTSATLDNSGNITSMGLEGLGSIVTYSDLINFASYDGVRPYNKHGLSQNPVAKAKIQLNSHDRFSIRPGRYFNQFLTQKHHTNVPASPGINVYSFAINPEEHQPSGTCNFSRISSAKLILHVGGIYDGGANGQERPSKQKLKVKIYAVNYNVLRIMSGMGGLAYA